MTQKIIDIIYSYIDTLPLEKGARESFIRIIPVVLGNKVKINIQPPTSHITLQECQLLLAHLNERTERRKKDGVYYTPEDVTEYMVLNAYNCFCSPDVTNVYTSELLFTHLATLSKVTIKRLLSAIVFDPTCGAGEFLLTAFRVKYRLLKQTRKRITDNDIIELLTTIRGNDIENDSISITKTRLLIECFSLIQDKKRTELILNALEGHFSNEDYVATIRLEEPKYDILLGNPPYVEYSTLNIRPEGGYGNVYCDVINNICNETSQNGVMAFVVPLSYVSTPRMNKIRTIVRNTYSKQFVLSFADRPDCLFVSAHQKLCILIGAKRSTNDTKGVYTSTYYYWYKSERAYLFKNLTTIRNENLNSDCYPKLGCSIEVSLYNKTHHGVSSLLDLLSYNGKAKPIYLNMRGCFWMKAFSFNPGSSEYKTFYVNEEYYDFIACLLNSSLFFTQWIASSDCWHITQKELLNYMVPNGSGSDFSKFHSLFKKLEKKLESTKVYIGSKQTEYEYKHRLCKKTIDEIDDALCSVYNLTPDELQYVKAFNLKYRLSNDEQ